MYCVLRLLLLKNRMCSGEPRPFSKVFAWKPSLSKWGGGWYRMNYLTFENLAICISSTTVFSLSHMTYTLSRIESHGIMIAAK